MKWTFSCKKIWKSLVALNLCHYFTLDSLLFFLVMKFRWTFLFFLRLEEHQIVICNKQCFYSPDDDFLKRKTFCLYLTLLILFYSNIYFYILMYILSPWNKGKCCLEEKITASLHSRVWSLVFWLIKVMINKRNNSDIIILRLYSWIIFSVVLWDVIFIIDDHSPIANNSSSENPLRGRN